MTGPDRSVGADPAEQTLPAPAPAPRPTPRDPDPDPDGDDHPDLGAGTGPEASSGSADSWRRLAPGMLLVEPVRELLRFIPLLLVLFFAGRAGDSGPPWGLVGAAAVVALGVTRYVTTRYRVTPAEIEIRRGLLTRRTSTVPRDRVRTVDISAHPLQRLLGLIRLEIGTGSSGDHRPDGLVLDGLRVDAGTLLRAELLAVPDPASESAGHHPKQAQGVRSTAGENDATATPAHTAADGGPATELARLRRWWILLAPLTLSGAMTAAVLLGLAWRLLGEARISPAQLPVLGDLIAYLRASPGWIDATIVAAIGLGAVVVLSIAGYVLAFWGFGLTREAGGTLRVRRGLLTTRETTIDERRLRGVQRSEPVLLRAARGARVTAITTGLRPGAGADRGSEVLLPPAPLVTATRVERAALRASAPVDAPLLPRTPAARSRRYVRAVGPAALLAAVAVGWSAWGGLPVGVAVATALTLVPAALLARDRFRSLGHVLLPAWLVTRSGSLIRRRTVLHRSGVIGVVLRRSFVQRRRGLATLVVTTAAGRARYALPDLTETTAVALARDLVPVARKFDSPPAPVAPRGARQQTA